MTLPARATLLLYTDGLVERRRTALGQGISRAAALVQEGRASTLDDLANQIMSGLAPAVSGRRRPPAAHRHPAPLELTFPADVSHLAPARTALRTWLTRTRLDPEQAMNVLVAAGRPSPTPSSTVTATNRRARSGWARPRWSTRCG